MNVTQNLDGLFIFIISGVVIAGIAMLSIDFIPWFKKNFVSHGEPEESQKDFTEPNDGDNQKEMNYEDTLAGIQYPWRNSKKIKCAKCGHLMSQDEIDFINSPDVPHVPGLFKNDDIVQRF